MDDVRSTFLNYKKIAEHESTAATLTLADALKDVAIQIRALGLNNAGTEMGAIDALGAVMKEGLEGISSALNEGFDRLG